MGRKRASAKLPEQLRKELRRLMADESLTLAQIVEHMQQLGVKVSESSVQRERAVLEAVSREARFLREVTLAMGRELEDIATGDANRVLIESMQGLLLKMRGKLAGKEEVDPKVIASMCDSIRDLASAWKSSVDVELKLRDRFAREAAAATEKTARDEGLSVATIDKLKSAILGLRKDRS